MKLNVSSFYDGLLMDKIFLGAVSMANKWHKTEFPGVRFKEHPIRKNGVKKDRYFSIYYRLNGKRKEEGVGWASEKWTVTNKQTGETKTENWTSSKASALLNELKRNQRTGEGPQTLAEKRRLATEKRKAEENRREQDAVNSITFEKFFEDVYKPIAEKNKKAGTLAAEKGHFKKWLKPELGKMPFAHIKPFHLEKLKKKMLDAGRTPRTIQYCFATFRQVWNHAKINDLVNTDSPTKKVKTPSFDNKRLRFLTQEEAAAVLKNLQTRSENLYHMALLSLHTGMRANEIFSLTWGDVDFLNDSLTIRDSKSGKTRYVYLTNDTREMFQSLWQGQASNDFVFKNRKTRKIDRISHSFQRAVDDLKLNQNVSDSRLHVCFHTLRHTFASWHIQNGTDLYTLKELLGHSTIQLTERYSHLRPDGLKKAVQSLDKKINGKSESNQHENKAEVRNLSGYSYSQ